MSEKKVNRSEKTDLTSVAQQQSVLRRYSVIAAWIGLLAIVVGLLWAAVKTNFSLVPLILVAGGGLLALFWLVANLASVVATARGRRSQLIANSAAFTVVVVGIAVLVNYLGVRHHLRKDLTESQQYSLSEQTHQVAQGLEQEVRLIGFISMEYYRGGEMRDLLREYEMLSPQIKVEQYDPKTEFSKAREYDVQLDGTIIVECAGRTEKITGGGEEQLTSAILAVTSGKKTKVYFLVGHGELSLEGGGKGVATLKRSLENQQYSVETLSLMAMKEPQVPGDCAALCILGPQQPLHDKEIDAINRYLSSNGKLFAAVDPPPAPNLTEMLSGYGITPLAGIVIDPELSLWGQSNVPMVNAPATHKITRNLGAVILPVTRAFELETSSRQPQYPGAPPPQPKATALLESSSSAWLEKTLEGTAKKDADDPAGPLVMAALVDETTSSAPMMPGQKPPSPKEGVRMVVVGSSIMMSDDLVNQGVDSGVYLALKSIAWLTENEKLISIPPKDTTPTYLTLSDQQRNTAIVAVFVLPALIILIGGVVWWRRRRG